MKNTGLIILVLLMASLACVIPGINTGSKTPEVISPGTTKIPTNPPQENTTVPVVTPEVSTVTPGGKIIGSWDCLDQQSNSGVLRFDSDGTLAVSTAGPEFAGTYTSDFSTTPVSIDLTFEGRTTLCILEFNDDNHMRIDGTENEPRPTSFGKNTMTCTRK